MQWLLSLDVGLFRFINGTLSNPFFDQVMPWLSGNSFFFPVVIMVGLLLIWKGGARGLLFLLMLALIVSVGDGFICRNMKHALGRERPFLALQDVLCLVGKSNSGSMPSSHAANWFAATMIAFIYYRSSLYVMLPVALAVSFSRVYCGVHFPSDVLAGAVLGAGYAAAGVWSLNALWVWLGQKWFPLWWEKMPSLVAFRPRSRAPEEPADSEFPEPEPEPAATPPHIALDQHWVRLGYVTIVVLLLARLFYIASGKIELVGDEAYQWLWSKHPALSYYSKPPLIAYTQLLGTSIWGDTELGVRFFSPVIAAVLAFLMLRFFARHVNARAGFFLVLIFTATPLTALGSILMTIDPLSVLFWTLAMLAGWRALQEKGNTADWIWVGIWMALGFLSKYTELFQLLCWAVFFALWPPARKHLRRPGPWLALLILAVGTLPVLIWNQQHNWITVTHVAADAGLKNAWRPTLRFFGEFLGIEIGLLSPVFFVAATWAAIAFWRRNRHNPLLVFFFSMGAPLFLSYLLYSFRSRILPNWIAPSVSPLFCLMVIYWDSRWRLGARRIKGWLTAGLIMGFLFVIVAHYTDLLGGVWKTAAPLRKAIASSLPETGSELKAKLESRSFPVQWDPHHRATGWKETARAANEKRLELLTEGKLAFIIADHYSLVGEMTFYLPEAKATYPENQIIYYQTTSIPRNQLYFWPGYQMRKGENAVFVVELDREEPKPIPAPARLKEEFDSVTDMGVYNVMARGQFLRPLQFFACRGLR